ncbi:hypothetical protein BRETT_001990 [Brettanomyces bruxellensis]|uniref:Protein kinase domain-containing protein n=1 Tax=Dekkera bruxellensis TaxID=5007 RepID=A0A871R989_DEKBR|nr:uncharacterized protein BRETT_001990 [Brettanomyces bruxellensis]QOU21826.1 hypothetical protein BRETT_001990 [Brettanomyces bruxellensis]
MSSKTNEKDQIPEFLYDQFPSEINSYSLNSTDDSPYASITPAHLDPHQATMGYIHQHTTEKHSTKARARRTSAGNKHVEKWNSGRKFGHASNHKVEEESSISTADTQKLNVHTPTSKASRDSTNNTSPIYTEVSSKFTSLMNSTDTSGSSMFESADETSTDRHSHEFSSAHETIGPEFIPSTLDPGIGKLHNSGESEDINRKTVNSKSSIDTSPMSKRSNYRDSVSINIPDRWSLSLHSMPTASSSSDSYSDEDEPISASIPADDNLHSSKTLTRGVQTLSQHERENSVTLDTPENCTMEVVVKWLRLHKFNETWVQTFSRYHLEKDRFYNLQSYENLRMYLQGLDTSDTFSTPARFLQLLRKEIAHQIIYRPPPSITVVTSTGEATSPISMVSSIVQSPTSMLSSDSKLSNFTASSTESCGSSTIGVHNKTGTSINVARSASQLGKSKLPKVEESRRKSDSSANSSLNNKYKLSPKSLTSTGSKFSSHITPSDNNILTSSNTLASPHGNLGERLVPVASAPIPQLRKLKDAEISYSTRVNRQSIPKLTTGSQNEVKSERPMTASGSLSHSPSLVRRFTRRHKRSSSATTSMFSGTEMSASVNTDSVNVRSDSAENRSPTSAQGPLHSRSKSKGSISDASTPKGLFNKFFGKSKPSSTVAISEESPVSPVSLVSMFSPSEYKKSRRTSFEGERKRLSMFLGDYTFNEKKKKSTDDFLSGRRNTTKGKKSVPAFEKIGPVGKKPSPAGVTIPVITTSKLHYNQNHVSLSATNIRKAKEIAASTRKLAQSGKSEAPYFFVDDKFRPSREAEESKLYILITADNVSFKAVAVDSIKTVDEMKDKFTSELGFTDGELSRFYLTDFGCKRGEALEEAELQKLLDSRFFGGVCKLYVQPLTKLKPMTSKDGIGLLELSTTQQISLKGNSETDSDGATLAEDNKQQQRSVHPAYVDEASEEILLPNQAHFTKNENTSRRSISEGAVYDTTRQGSLRRQKSVMSQRKMSFRGTSTAFPGSLATSYSDHLARTTSLRRAPSGSISRSKLKKRSPSITRAKSIARTSGDYSSSEDRENGRMRSFRVIRSERKEVDFDQRRKTPFVTPSTDMSSSRRLSMSGAAANLVALRSAPPPPDDTQASGSKSLKSVSKVNRKPPPAFPPETLELMERRSSLRKLISLSRKSTIRRKNTTASVRSRFDPFAENEVNFADAPELDSSSTSSESSSGSDSDLFAKVPTKPLANANSAEEEEDSSDHDDDVSTIDSNTKHELDSKDVKAVSFSSDAIEKPSGNSGQATGPISDAVENKSFGMNSTSTSNTSRSKTDSSELSFTLSSSDSSLDIRPPAEVVYDNLELYFPNADLDKMIIDEVVSPPVSPIVEHPDVKNNVMKEHRKRKPLRSKPTTPKVHRTVNKSNSLGGGQFHRMKSIRIVAQEAKRKAVMRQSSARRGGNLLRRKSTKMWGQKVIEVTPGTSSEVYVNKLRDKKGRFKQFAWVKGELIGVGTFGKVYLAMNVTTGEMIAVKQTTISSRFLDNREMKELVKSFKAEVETLKDLDHENIVQYLGFGMKDNTYSIFLEYVSGGSVGHLIRSYGQFPEDLIRYLTKQVLQGLTYIHSRGILHRDLKADNLLLENDGVCKISDFGISKKSKDIYSNQSAMTFQGTIFWMAPEIIDAKAHNGYSAKVDIWSLGCVVLEMYAGKRPWHDFAAAGAIFRLGKKSAPPISKETKKRISPCGMKFLERCFEIDPEKRPTAADLLKDEFCQVRSEFKFENTELAKKMRYDNAQERRRMQLLKTKTRN